MKRRIAQLALAAIAALSVLAVAAPAFARDYNENINRVSKGDLKTACSANGGTSASISRTHYSCVVRHDDGSIDVIECQKSGCDHTHFDPAQTVNGNNSPVVGKGGGVLAR